LRHPLPSSRRSCSPRGVGQLHAVRDDHLGLELAFADALQQFGHEALHVRLAHLEGQALLEGIAEQEAVDEARIHARHAHHAAAPRGRDALAQRLAAGAFHLQVGQHRFQRAALGLEADRVDGRVDAVAAGGGEDDLRPGPSRPCRS
jgi:hypothetical protein